MKKLTALCLALCLVGSAVPFVNIEEFPEITANAEEEAPTSGTCGENVYWSFDKERGTLTISGMGEMEKFLGNSAISKRSGTKYTSVFNGRGWDVYFDQILSVTVQEGVTSIANKAFSHNISLSNVMIPNTVIRIENDAFCNCESLTDITILNPNCEIYDSPLTILSDYYYDITENKIKYEFFGIIHGYPNSTAQAYAEKYGYKFEPIGETPTEDKISGDLNGDGDLTVTDVIEFNQKLRNRKALPKNCDMNNDSVVNVIDLALLKRALLNK